MRRISSSASDIVTMDLLNHSLIILSILSVCRGCIWKLLLSDNGEDPFSCNLPVYLPVFNKSLQTVFVLVFDWQALHQRPQRWLCEGGSVLIAIDI